MVIQVSNLATTRQAPPRVLQPDEKKGWTTQDISGRSIDVSKLIKMLRVNFEDSFDIYMMHNCFHVEAPRKLSQVSPSFQCDREKLLTKNSPR